VANVNCDSQDLTLHTMLSDGVATVRLLQIFSGGIVTDVCSLRTAHGAHWPAINLRRGNSDKKFPVEASIAANTCPVQRPNIKAKKFCHALEHRAMPHI